MNREELETRFEFRYIHQEEADQAVEIEWICFPPHEACTEKMMTDRLAAAADCWLTAIDKETGRIAGYLTGIATDEQAFRDEFFFDASLHQPEGENVMLLSLNVLPAYRGQGLAREIMRRYLENERGRGRKKVVLTCLEGKIQMYERMGFQNLGISASRWGDEEWYEMSHT